MTPEALATDLVGGLPLTKQSRVLEPSFGTGSFLLPLIRRFMSFHSGTKQQRLEKTLKENVFGVEIDSNLFEATSARIRNEFGALPPNTNLVNNDFFRTEYPSHFFDFVVGNPPFGGTFDPEIEDALDRRLGRWNGLKIKKETYSFFIVRSLDLLKEGGRLVFIASDTCLTIPTMSGLRQMLLDQCSISIQTLPAFSEETTQPTLILRADRNGYATYIELDEKVIDRSTIELTRNFSWRIDENLRRYFGGPVLGDYVIATSGMTVGKNELFVREISPKQTILEPFEFHFFEDPITLKREVERARLNKISPKLMARVSEQERLGETRRNVRVTKRDSGPVELALPHPDYRYYNKAQSGIIYRKPTHAIFWKDDGDAVLTFKKNGNWYLHGVGGRAFFGREGLTWQLVASKLNPRYLPPGFILDSGAPCAFLRPDVSEDELYFILAWLATDLATTLLKSVLNHTRNIQSKDVERLPYPYWVDPSTKVDVISHARALVEAGKSGIEFVRDSQEIIALEEMFIWR